MTGAIKVFTADEKAVLRRELRKLVNAGQGLLSMVKEDKLPEGMAGGLTFLLESHFAHVAKVMNYESVLTLEKEERHVEIRNANRRIRELEEIIGSERGVDGLKEQLRHLAETISDWWGIEGFNHVSEGNYFETGAYQARFCFMLESRGSSMYGDTPDTDKRTSQEHTQKLRDAGFVFTDKGEDRYEKLLLQDTEKNREKLVELVTGRFPSAVITKVGNRKNRNATDFAIWDMEVIIYNLEDI